MPRINLLPWRAQRREQRKRRFISMMIGSFLFSVTLMVLADQHFSANIEYQNARNTFLKSQIAVLDRNIREISELKKRRQQLLDRIKIIQDLQVHRPVTAHVFDQVIRTLPEGVYFSDLRMQGSNLFINGFAESNAKVSSLMRNMDASEWLEAPNLTEVKAANGREAGQKNRFQLTVQRSQPPAPSAATTTGGAQ